MSVNRTDRASAPVECGVGNIYDRLEDARKKRAQILETPEPANQDWEARRRRVSSRQSFPTLKPPKPQAAEPAPRPRQFGWTAPLALSLLILLVLFVYAVR